ncbi:MAG TPA: PaaI family thioesterase [Burkholderiaceae bacterium]|nr:PaaI family thioesterase [Burkholderiaceae bacterium]
MTEAQTTTASNPAIPTGFRLASVGGAFIGHNGPLYARLENNRLLLGFRVEDRHTNPLKNCHGGMLATFADMLLPCAVMYQCDAARRFLPTISLQIDYLAPAPLGAWVQGEADILRSTRNMIFAQGLVHADGTPAMRVSGIFKQGPLIGDGSNRDPLSLR